MDLLRPTYLHIHLDKLMANYRRLQTISQGQSFLCPMIKANAYGHGDVAAAKALIKEGCQFVGVASVDEGKHLRDHHVATTILVFGFYGKDAAEVLLSEQLTPVVSTFEQLDSLRGFLKEPLKIHLKFNTGMNRLGFVEKDLAQLESWLRANPLFEVQGICSHFHSGENLTRTGSSSFQQEELFKKIVGGFGPKATHYHLYNSAAMAALHRDRGRFSFGCRPGLLVYGIDPSPDLSLKPLVSPVMELKSKIVAIQEVKSGEVVSYGGSWQARQDSLIGIVPAGYADGVCRSLSDVGQFLVKEMRVPIRGRVCMDYTMVDLTALKLSKDHLIGEDVVIIGRQGSDQITVEEIAQWSQRITYEIMTGISERVPRFYGVANG